MATNRKCPHCNADLVIPTGPKDAPILIVGDVPYDKDLEWLQPFTGGVGKVLRETLGKEGIDIRQCRLTNLWLHAKNNKEECFTYGLQHVIRLSANKKGILLLGADVSKVFTKHLVSEISGLRVEEDCTLISAPVIIATVNPAIVFNSKKTPGEYLLAIKRFSEAMEEYL